MSCLSPDASSTITSRPKLTLQTTSLPRTFGTSTTGLSFSFAAAPASSPTVRNTFKNAYEVASPSSATSPTKPSRYNKPSSPYILHPNNNIFNHRSPYQLPIGVRSILRNSPLEPSARRRSGSISAGGNGPNGAGTRRVFFPAKKQVSYRYPLEEEIRTERYTAQHLDLVTEEEEAVQAEADTNSNSPSETRPAPFQNLEGEKETSDSSPSLSETSTSDDTSADEGVRGSSLSKMERKKRRTMRTERQVRAVALLDGFEADGSSTPQTPMQGRAKRRREWKWTLGPVDLSGDKASNDFGSENVSLLHAAQGNSGSETLRVSTDFAPSH
ncbi:hypothetical protein LT330_001498 [Penicillium expansum]|uniref:Uncharacterized protein n=1 Tax=Penicillium expansum TaxID=27334 RepID=A0A0A2I6I8_PENEN|nr:hypothetical protein PEX2_007740 [Penicillium expansum]KAK4864875.1 hypothetical protein LT330_001498 [Penicillium expansum]KGO38053.1 hypothetical protein PEXP_080690 [Penicillium expansum]KGO51657.1 hypothetical protein PEX2_007740 [Penicillium expansum]KGO66869.1 hypothetical protein PEX1_077090 [Penicillium expansum]